MDDKLKLRREMKTDKNMHPCCLLLHYTMNSPNHSSSGSKGQYDGPKSCLGLRVGDKHRGVTLSLDDFWVLWTSNPSTTCVPGIRPTTICLPKAHRIRPLVLRISMHVDICLLVSTLIIKIYLCCLVKKTSYDTGGSQIFHHYRAFSYIVWINKMCTYKQ